jgi:hypothetical protein
LDGGDDIDEEPADQHLLDSQLLDPQLFGGEGQLVGRLFNRQLSLSGPVLPQIPLTAAGELVNLPLNQAVDDVASQSTSPAVVPQVDEIAGRPARPRKRSQVAIEAADELILQVSGRKRQKRTG